MDTAKWQQIKDFPDYAISSHGEVKTIKTGKLRLLSRNQFGVLKVTLSRGCLLYTRSVPVLVADAFLPKEFETFNSLIHLDGKKDNSDLDNLMRRPRWFAIKYHKQFERPDFHYRGKGFEVRDTGERFVSFYDACSKYGLLAFDIRCSMLMGDPVFPTKQRFV